jgi:hypothetical protein
MTGTSHRCFNLAAPIGYAPKGKAHALGIGGTIDADDLHVDSLRLEEPGC